MRHVNYKMHLQDSGVLKSWLLKSGLLKSGLLKSCLLKSCLRFHIPARVGQRGQRGDYGRALENRNA